MDWQCTEHGRLWSGPLRWTPGVLLHRVVDTAANAATSSCRHLEGQFVSLFSIPPCPPTLLVEMAGSTYVAPAEAIRKAVGTHSPSRLLRLLDQGVARLKSARGIKSLRMASPTLRPRSCFAHQNPIAHYGRRSAWRPGQERMCSA